MSNELINKSLDEWLFFHYETFSEDYSPVEYEEKITILIKNVIDEIDRNILNCNSLFATLNYISATIKRIEIDNHNNFLFYEELEHIFCFNYEYENLQAFGNDFFEFEVVESNKIRCSKRSLAFRKAYYSYLNIQAFSTLNRHLYDVLGRYNVNNEIAFDFNSLEEYENYYNLNKLIRIILRQCGNNYPYFLKEFFKNQAPIFFIQIKNSYFAEDVNKIKDILKSIDNNPKTMTILKSFSIQIENSKFLDKKIVIEKYFNYENYIKTGIKELLNMNGREIYNFAYNSKNPNLLFLTTNKTDFDIFFKDQNIDLAVYDKKREEYINLFKYQIISDFYKLIQSYILTNNSNETIEQTIQIVKPTNELVSTAVSVAPSKYDDYSYIFNKSGFELFEKLFEIYKSRAYAKTYFNIIFHKLKGHYIYGNISGEEYKRFLENYSRSIWKEISISNIKDLKKIHEDKKTEITNEIKNIKNKLKV